MKTSTDLFFCAFLKLKGIEMASYEVLQRGKISCSFELSDNQWKSLKLEFNNSDHSKIKQYIENLKDLAY